MYTPKFNRHSAKLAALAAGICLAFAQPSAQAQINGTWNPTGSNESWNTAGSWVSGTVAGGAGSVVNFNRNITATLGVNVNAPIPVVGIMNIGDSNGTHGYTLQTGTLTLNNNGSAAQINFLSSGTTNTVIAPLLLIDSLETANASAFTQSISAAISSGTTGLRTITNSGGGSGAVSMSGIITNGSGTLAVIQNSLTSALNLGNTGNTFSGGVTVQSGTVFTVGGSAALGTGTLTLGNSSGSANTAVFGNFNGVNHTNAISVASSNSGTASLGALQGTTFSGAVTLNSHDLFLLTGTTAGLTVSGGVSGTGNLTLSSAFTGTITLSTGAINNIGTITNSGTGSAANVISAPIGTNVTGVVQDSATSSLTLSGSSTFTSGITIRSGTLIGTSTSNSLGANSNTITIGASSGSANATLLANAGGTFANPISVASSNTGTARISTQSDATFTGAITLNSHDLFVIGGRNLNLSGGVSGTGNVDFANNSAGFTMTVQTNGINNVGTVTHSGSSTGITNITAPIGSNVTQVIQNQSNIGLTLSGSNTFGGLTIQSGTVNAAGTSTTPVGSGTILLGHTSGAANTTLVLSNTTSTYANALVVQASNTGTASLFANATSATTYSGLITVNRDLYINSTNGGGSPSLTLSGTTTGAALTGAGNVIFSSTFSNNFQELRGNNSGFTGNILINTGSMRLGSVNALSVANTVAVNSGTLATFNIQAFSPTIAGLNDGANGGGRVTNSGAAATLTLGGSGTYAFSGSLTATTPANLAITKTGAGTQTLSGTSSYTGVTTITGGVLAAGNLANGGVNSAIGASGTAAANLVINGGTLRYSGTGGSTDRLFTTGTAGATLDASGSGAISFTNTGTGVQTTPAASRSLTLTGTNTGNNTFAGRLTDAGAGATSLVKNGTGTWIATGSNSYTGGTTVNAGTLLVSNATGSGLGTGNVVVNGGKIGGSGAFTGGLTIVSGGTLSPGSSIETLGSGTLTFNTGSTYEYEIDSSVALSVGADLQKVAGDLNLSGTVTLTLADLDLTPTAFTQGTVFSLVNYTGIWNTGLFTFGGNAIVNGTTFTAGLNIWRLDYNAAAGGSNFSTEYFGGSDSFVNITAVPEPGTTVLFGLGSAFMLWNLRRRRS